MFGVPATPARSDERSAAVSSEQLTRLTLEQALDADYVFDATRGEDLYQPAKVTNKDAEDDEPETHQGKGVLVSTVLSESRTEHLTSGFMGSVRDREAHQVMARLARELAALGLSADTSYQTLTNKRAIMLSRLYAAYEADHRKHKAASSRRRKFDVSPLSPMVEIGISSGVHTMLSILAHSAVQDHPLCVNLLVYLQSKLQNVPAMAFSLGVDSTAAELSLETFDAIHDTLLACATLPVGGAKGTTQEIRDRSLELLLGVAVSRGSLSYFLSVVNLLLHATVDGKRSVAIRGLLRKLRAVQRESVLDLPSAKKLDGFVAVPDLGTGWSAASTGSMATDGTYLYLHNHGGLFKIGTGFNGTTPGTIYGQIKGYRGGEQSSMVCIGDRLYYRSAHLYPILFSVISTVHLTEIGSIRRDGAGTVATPDLTWYFPIEEDEKKEEKGDSKMERDGKSSDRPTTATAAAAATPVAVSLARPSTSGGLLASFTTSTSTTAAGATAATAAAATAAGWNRLKPMRGQIFGDGTFLYALQPRPIGEKPVEVAKPVAPVAASTAAATTSSTAAATTTGGAAHLVTQDIVVVGGPNTNPAVVSNTSGWGSSFRGVTAPSTYAPFAGTSSFSVPTNAYPTSASSSPFGSSGFSSGFGGGFGSSAPSSSFGSSFGSSSLFAATPASSAPSPWQPAPSGFSFSSNVSPSYSSFGATASPAPVPLSTSSLLPALPPTDPAKQRGEYAIQVFEPSRNFDHCHTTVLYRPIAEGKNNTVLHFKSNQVADPATGRRPAYAMLTLGNPDHLNFAGSVTMECWLKIPREIWAQRGTIGLFYHGDGRSNLYLYISSHQLYMGYQSSTNGNQAVAVMISTVDTSEWFHVAGIYDQATQQFRLHVNGAMLRNQAAGVGPERSTGNWFVGSSTAGHIFTGALAEVRIWKVARTEDQIRQGMRSVPAGDTDGLAGYWPLNDGLGLRVADVSTNKHFGSLRTCQWQDDKRPFEHPKQRHTAAAAAATAVVAAVGAAVTGTTPATGAKDAKDKAADDKKAAADSKLIPYDFSHQALPQTICYANGESFAIIYPAKIVSMAFDNAQNQSGMAARQDAVVQVFSIATGVMIYESENDYLADAISSVVAPTADAVWLQSLKEPSKLNRFTIRPPSTISKWRLDRQREEQTAGFPTARQLSDRYKLSTIGEQGDHRDHRRGKPLGEAVEIHQATMAILARLEQDCSLTSQPDAGDAPNSLTLPLAVEASKRTFQSLLELAELLAADYYKSETDLKKAYDKNSELRLFAFLVTLRLLRTNIVHVVGWNVDPTECGFANDLQNKKKKTDANKKDSDAKDGEEAKDDEEDEEKEQPAADDDAEDDEFMRAVAEDAAAEEKKKPPPPPASAAMHTRYTSLLNRLILDAPTSPVAKLIAPRIHEEVCESLSVGMSVFFGVASERVTILGELVNGALARYQTVAAGQQKPVVNPLRLLLMNRYFGKLAMPRNVISIVPALTANPNAAAAGALVPAKSDPKAVVVADDHKGSPLLIDVFTLAFNTSKERLEKYFAGEITDPWAAAEQKAGGAGPDSKKQPTAAEIAEKADAQAPLEFLQKLQLVLLARLAHQSRTSIEYRYAMDYALHVITKVAELLNYCLASIDTIQKRAATETGTAAPPSVTVGGKKYDVISAKSFAARTLQEGVGSVVVPLLTGIWSVNLGAESAARLVQPLYGLLSAADRLCSGMPDIVAREAQSLEGRGQRVQVSRSVTVESQHPCPAGLCEKLLSVPGAKEMKVSIDTRTFPGTQGTSVAFYRKSGQNDAIEGANFNRHPGKPFEVTGDSVYIVFNPGFNPNAWGFLATATAMVEEVKVEVPYCLDVAKAASLLAGKCTISLVRGESTQPAEVDAAKLLSNELLSEGVEVDDILDKKEHDQLSWLPKTLVPVVATPAAVAPPPPLVRATSGQAAASIAALVSDLTAKLTAAGITAGAFPVPDGAKDSVARAIGAVHGVLIKHNGLLRDAASYIAGTLSRDNSDNLIRVWKTAFKLRQWFLQRYQEIRSASKDEANIDKVEVYETLCKQVIQRCAFLVDLVPVPRPDEKKDAHHDEKSGDMSKPGLIRQTSKENAEQSEADKKARATLLVWKSTKETGKLRDAHTDDERLSLVWKLVFSFISATDLKLDQVRDAMAVRRRRTRTRARGLAIMKDLLEAVSLSSLKREVIASLVPALHVNDTSLYAGQPADPLAALSSGGRVLQGQTRAAFHAIFTSLARILFTPNESGAPLLQATLHAFSLHYTEDDFQLLEKLKIFPGLHKLLSSGSDDESSASFNRATAHTSAWALLDLLTTAILSNPDLEVVQVAGAAPTGAPEHGKLEPIYVILEAQLQQIATALQRDLLRDEESKPSSSVGAGTMGFGSTPRTAVPKVAATAAPFAAFGAVPTAAAAAAAPTASTIAAAVALKMNTVTAFGMEQGKEGAGVSTVDGEFADAFNIKVLNLVDKIARLGDGRQRVSDRMMPSLLRIMKTGSPRARVVVMRILRRLWTGTEAPSLARCDTDMVASDPKKDDAKDGKDNKDGKDGKSKDDDKKGSSVPSAIDSGSPAGDTTVRWFLRHIGQAMLAPSFTALALNEQALRDDRVKNVIRQLKLSPLYSTDSVSVWSEEVMLLRHLANSSPSWHKVLDANAVLALKSLPTVLASFRKYHERCTANNGKDRAAADIELAINPFLWDDAYLLIGVLNVIGGYIDSIRVGTRVRVLPDGPTGTVVARTGPNVRVIRDEEGTVSVTTINQVVCLSDIPFSPSLIAGLDVNNLLATLVPVLESICTYANELPNFDSDGLSAAPTIGLTVFSTLYTRVIRLAHSLCLTPTNIQTLVTRHPSVIRSLYRTALAPRFESGSPVAMIEDTALITNMEMIRRARLPVPIIATVKRIGSMPTVTMQIQNGENTQSHVVLGTRLGQKIADNQSIKAQLSYVRFNEAPHADKCADKLVLLDTYNPLSSSFRLRAKQCADLGARAIILALSKATPKEEGIGEETAEDEKKMKALADEEKKRARAGVNVVEAARAATLTAFAAATATAAPTERKERKALMNAFTAATGAAATATTDEDGNATAAATAAAASSSSTTTATDAKVDEAKEAEIKKLEDDLKGIPFVCVPQTIGQSLRTLLGVRDSEQPEILYRNSLKDRLLSQGHSLQHSERALTKSNWDIHGAEKWLADNAGWLKNAELLGELETEELKDNDRREALAKEKSEAEGISFADALAIIKAEEGANSDDSDEEPTPKGGRGLGASSRGGRGGFGGAVGGRVKRAARPARGGGLFDDDDEGSLSEGSSSSASDDDDMPRQAGRSAVRRPVVAKVAKEGKDKVKDGEKKDKKKDKDEEEEDEGDLLLEDAWLSFVTATRTKIQVAAEQEAAARQPSFQSPLINYHNEQTSIAASPSHRLVDRVISNDGYILSAYARRILSSSLEHWPRTVPLAFFGPHEHLLSTLHMSMTLDAHQSGELQPEQHLKARDFRRQLLRNLIVEALQPSRGNYLSGVIQNDVAMQLESITIPTTNNPRPVKLTAAAKKKAAAKAKVIARKGGKAIVEPEDKKKQKAKYAALSKRVLAAVNPTSKPVLVQLKLEGATSLSFTFEIKTKIKVPSITVSFYRTQAALADELLEQVVLSADAKQNAYVSAQVCGGQVWYAATADGFDAKVHGDTNVVVMAERGQGSGTMTSLGSLDTALTFIDVLLCVRQPAPTIQKLLQLLLRALPWVNDKTKAQAFCHTASMLFARYKEVRSELSNSEVTEMASRVIQLERAHGALRRATMVNWNNGGLPSPHLQTLLELILAARRALPESSLPKPTVDSLVTLGGGGKGRNGPQRSPTAGGNSPSAAAMAKKGEAMKGQEEKKMADDEKEEKKGRGNGDDFDMMPEFKGPPDGDSKDEKDEKGESKGEGKDDDEKKKKEKEKGKGGKDDQETQRQKKLGLFPAPPPNEHMIESFRRHRDGEPLCALISLGQKEILEGLHIGSKKGGNNGGGGGARRRGNYGYDDGYNDDPYYDGTVQTYVGAGSVKGGKWYYEVTITARRPQALCIGWVSREFQHTGNHLSNDYSGHAWCIYGPNNQYYHRSKQAGVRQTVPSQVGHWEPGTVIGVMVDMDKRVMNWSYDGVEEPTPPYQKWDVDGGLFPALSVGKAECQVNFGRFKFQYPPDSKKHPDWSPFEHPAIRMSSWLERYMHAYDVTQLVYARSSLPEKIVESVLEQELMSLERDNEMPFELVDYDKPPQGQSATGTPTGLLIDSATQFYPHTAKNFHISFKVSTSQETSFYLREVRVRCQQGAPCSGLVFVSQTKPDYDSFEWCNDFQALHYKRWLARKKSQLTAGQALTFGSHEPVGCITTDKGSDAWSTCKLEIPVKGAYITLKLSEDAGNGLGIEFIRFSVVHGEHPLGGIITAALIAEKTREIGIALRSGARWGEAASSLTISPSGEFKKEEKDSKEVKSDSALTLATPSSGQLNAAGKEVAGGWTLAMDEALVAMLQSIASRLGIAPAVLDAVVLTPTANDLGRFPSLETVPVEALRSRSALLKYLNKVNTPLLHYVDITTYEKDSKSYLNDPALHNDVRVEMEAAKAGSSSSSSTDEKKETKALVPASSPKASSSSGNNGPLLLTSSGDDASLSFVVHQLKGLFFISTKRSVFEALLAQILPPEGSYTPPRITINRIRASKMKDTPQKDPTGQSSVFGQIFNQLRSIPAIQMRATKKDQQMWNVTFLGEGSVDVGGPYRESLTNMCADLMSTATPLFIRSANGRNSVGLNREKWVPNPSANTPLHLSMYEFVGVLMGLGMTSKFPLSLDFPSLVWKGILGQTGDRSDLEGVDKLCMQAMAEVSHLPRDSFATAFSEKFVTQLTDNTEVELKKDGRLITVTYENRNEFIDLVIKTRLGESARQLAAIQKGLGSVVPLRMLGLFSCHDLEVLVCGNPYIDIEALRRHTVYAATLNAGHQLVKFFFDALHSFNMEERQLFLRFVWGRNRLPATDNDWSTNFTINHLPTASDESLPISHTCFFSIDLPNYSSLDTMKKKLLYAIYNCTAIDVDFNPNASQLQAWVD